MIATSTHYRVRSALATVVGMAVVGLAVGGCCGPCGDRHHRGCGPGGGYFGMPATVCFGYASTCWHAWPAECVGCPPHTYPPQTAEPIPAKTMPEPAIQPPAEATPVPEPSPSDETPEPETKQSRQELSAPVLTIDPTPLPASQELLETIEPSPAVWSSPPAVSKEATPIRSRAEPLIATHVLPLTERPSPVVSAPLAEERRATAQSRSLPGLREAPPASRERSPMPSAPTARTTTRPRFQLPALLNLVHGGEANKRRSQPTTPPEIAAKAAARVPAEFGPPPPVYVEEPEMVDAPGVVEAPGAVEASGAAETLGVAETPAFANKPDLASTPDVVVPSIVEAPGIVEPPHAPIQVMHYQNPPPAVGNAPAMIINRTANFEHQPPPPVLVETPMDHTPFIEAQVVSDSPAQSEMAPVVAPSQVEPRQKHIIADWRFGEPSIVPRNDESQNRQHSLPEPAVLAPVESEPHLAPIVSPASVLRRMPPVKAQ